MTHDDIRRWWRTVTRRGQGKHLSDHAADFATNAFFREIGMYHQTFYGFLRGEQTLTRRQVLLISRFAADWEAGKLAFTKPGRGLRHPYRPETPRPRRTRMAVDLSGATPRLKLLDRIQAPARMPDFRELIVSKT